MKNHLKPLAIILAISVVSCWRIAEVPAGGTEPAEFQLRVSAPKADCVNVPVFAALELPERFARLPVEEISVLLEEQGGAGVEVPGQIVSAEEGKTQLWWILPTTKTGETSSWTAIMSHRGKASPEGFMWQNKPGDHLDLLFDGRRVVSYMYAYDDSTPERLHDTNKPYHHVFDAQGENLLTNGPGGLYPHHRGIFIGWTKLESGGEALNFWGMTGGVQRHQKFLKEMAGPVLACSESQISWDDTAGGSIIIEQRKVTVFRQSSPTILLLDFHTRLEVVAGEVFLDGDPEHGGFQYRAHNDVSTGSERAQKAAAASGEQVPQDVVESTETDRATYLFHNEDIDPLEDEDLPWAAMAYGLNNRRYSVQHMNHPGNPQPTLYSAYRDYGRFGAFFKKKIGSGESLALYYRILVVEGDMPARGDLAGNYSAFADAPEVEVVSSR
ncbi:MAG: PmoA family protein [Fidelibacterota bacterium]|nr:MAG: PmoA family protein [Candidatus Neomarinimicrobiota bacterium]